MTVFTKINVVAENITLNITSDTMDTILAKPFQSQRGSTPCKRFNSIVKMDVKLRPS